MPAHLAPTGGLYLGTDPPLTWTGHLWESGSPEYAINFKTVVEWLAKPCPYGPQVSVCTFRSYRAKNNSGQHYVSLKDCGERSKDWVLRKDYFVAEFDTLPRDQFGNVIRWIQRHTTLRAVIDTGGKSLHAWFDDLQPPPRLKPPEPEPRGPDDLVNCSAAEWEDYKRACADWKQKYKAEIARDRWQQAEFHRRKAEFYAILRGLCCDPGMFRLACTARLPGVERADANGHPTGRWQRLLYLNPKYPVQI